MSPTVTVSWPSASRSSSVSSVPSPPPPSSSTVTSCPTDTTVAADPIADREIGPLGAACLPLGGREHRGEVLFGRVTRFSFGH